MKPIVSLFYPFYLETNEFNASGGMGLGKMFSDPSLIAKLATNPRTAKHLADPAFMQKLKMFQSNPILANKFVRRNSTFSPLIFCLVPYQTMIHV